MRIAALAAALGLLVPASAEGDGFVRADPSLRGFCGAAAGDVVVAAHALDDLDFRVELSEAGGPARVLRGRWTCPDMAAAPDGTAVVAGLDVRPEPLLVRRPGTGFAPAGRVPALTTAPRLAGAPGGWVAAGWGEDPSTGGRRPKRDVVVVVAPDGDVRRTVLPGGRPMAGPEIGIDAHGTATAAWATTGGAGWTASAGAAGHWAPPRRLPGATRDPSVAVSPAGHTLIAWADAAGILAQEDGGPPVRIATARGARRPVAAVADDGAALVAFARPAAQVSAAGHAGGTPWSPAHRLSTSRTRPFAGGWPPDTRLRAAIAADGRALVAWNGPGRHGTPAAAFAAGGRAGGAWMPARRLSTAPRSYVDSVALDATGSPFVLWAEGPDTGPGPRDRLRGARLR